MSAPAWLNFAPGSVGMKHRQGVTVLPLVRAWAPCLATHGFTQHILCVRSAEAPGFAASPRGGGSPLRGASRTIWRCMPPGGRVCHARCGAGPRARPGSGRARRAGILHANLPVCGCASHAGALPHPPLRVGPLPRPKGARAKPDPIPAGGPPRRYVGALGPAGNPVIVTAHDRVGASWSAQVTHGSRCPPA